MLIYLFMYILLVGNSPSALVTSTDIGLKLLGLVMEPFLCRVGNSGRFPRARLNRSKQRQTKDKNKLRGPAAVTSLCIENQMIFFPHH